jgi:hypothetical protein
VRLDLTLILYWSSLGLSAAAVVLFLWLMRWRDRETGDGRGETNEPKDDSPT